MRWHAQVARRGALDSSNTSPSQPSGSEGALLQAVAALTISLDAQAAAIAKMADALWVLAAETRDLNALVAGETMQQAEADRRDAEPDGLSPMSNKR